MADLNKLLLDVTRSIVEFPDQISIEEKEQGDEIIFTLHVAESDMGKVIGRHGKNAKCIRTLMKAAAGTMNKKVTVDID